MIVALPAAHSDGVYQMPALAHHGGPTLLAGLLPATADLPAWHL
jgi:hypothetical protein